ncbi:MAG TPA: sodium:solute symporter family protein [Acidobacteriota bacterium]|nr:sodium:solute symporter family protein [Acidobacteriota bacterium]
MIIAIISIYMLSVLAVGTLSHRLFRGTGEDYFVATRTIGPFVLLMSLFGTHMTSFTLLGASAQAYSVGVGVFGLLASSSALVVPVIFFFVGTRIWALGKRYGYLTPVQFFRDRWDSSLLGLVLFVVLVAFVIPYLLIGVMGGGIAIEQISQGAVPEWLGALVICLVVMTYVVYGGMRGTAWVNTFQTLVFMSLAALAFVWIAYKLGGITEGIERVAEVRPDLLVREGRVQPLKMISYVLIPVSAGMFPHLFIHWLTARKAETFRTSVIGYPICVGIVWICSVLIGLYGAADFPGLQGPEANSILVRMIRLHSPELLAGLLAAGVVAAIMSSLDSQVLCLSTMFTQDIVRHYAFGEQMSEKRQIFLARVFVAAILGMTFLIFLVSNRSIFNLGIWCFTGFASLFPIVLAALFWKRSSKAGVLASVIVTVLLWSYFFLQGWRDPSYTVLDSGLMPVTVVFAASCLALWTVSLATPAPRDEVLQRFF